MRFAAALEAELLASVIVKEPTFSISTIGYVAALLADKPVKVTADDAASLTMSADGSA